MGIHLPRILPRAQESFRILVTVSLGHRLLGKLACCQYEVRPPHQVDSCCSASTGNGLGATESARRCRVIHIRQQLLLPQWRALHHHRGADGPPAYSPEYWRERLAKASAMGLNTIFSYVYWNLLEPEPGEVWNFRGQSSLFRSCSDHHPGPSHFFSQRFPFAACGRCDIQDGEPPFSYSPHGASHWVVWSLTLVAAVANQ